MRQRALETILVAAALDVIAGVIFAVVEHLSIGTGLYWAVATATTVGYGDVTPHTTAGRCVAVVAMLTVIPLFAATFSLITSGLSARHIDRVRQRVDHVIFHSDIPDFEEKT